MSENSLKQNETLIDLNYFAKKISKYWYVFVGSVFFAIVSAYFINKYSSPIYEVASSILINEEGTNPGSSAQLLQELGIQVSDRNFANEMSVMKSYPVVEEALKKLDFQISYFQHDFLQTKELYKSTPFLVVIYKDHPQPINCRLNVKFNASGTVTIKLEGQSIPVYSFVTDEVTQVLSNYNIEKEYTLNDYIQEEHMKFKIIVNNNFSLEELAKQKYSFVINSKDNLIRVYQSKLIVESPNMAEESTVAQLKIRTAAPYKATDFLNALINTYLENEISEKQHSSLKTIEYIDNQINVIKDSLMIAEENLQRFRANNQVVDISIQSQQAFSELRELEDEKAQIEIKQEYFDYINEQFNKNQEYSDLITPSAMGIDDPMLNNLIQELVTLNTERNSFLENNQEKSPYLRRINIRIENLRNMISENINYIEQTTEITLKDLNSRIEQLNRNLSSLPKTERELFSMQREFNINDNIYTFLLEKKAEAEIAKASYQADAEVLDPPKMLGSGPISPKKDLNYLFALILGIALPISVLRVIDLLKTTFDESDEIENKLEIPFLGKIYHNNKETEAVVKAFPKSHIAESFRMIAVNLGYFRRNNSSKIVAITSTISGEGKSFVSLNLAQTLADNGHKCVLIGYDIRKPKDYASLGNNVGPGLSSYLSNQSTIHDIVLTSNKPNLDFILAGSAPPNPFELIASENTDELINILRLDYDYIILDTPPIGVVTDGYLLMEKADLNLIVMRLKRTPKKEFRRIIKEINDKNLRTSLIINDMPLTKAKRKGYGYYE